MKTMRAIPVLFLVTSCAVTAPLAQGGERGAQAQAAKQQWLRYEKELGLQTRYSADLTIQSMGMNMAAKLYRLDGKTRTDTTLPFLNTRLVSLELEENGKPVQYTVFPDKKKYCVEAGGEEDGAGAQAAAPKLEDAGTEVYEGVTCRRRRMTVPMEDGATGEMTLLFSPAQKNMPVKITSVSRHAAGEPGAEPMTVTAVVLFKNYLFAAPAAALFAIPKDYTQAKDMTEMMLSGGGPGGGGLTLPPEALKALLQAQKEAEQAPPSGAAGEGAATAPQNLENLRRLLGK